jgi:UDP-GlcNAc:undecaprenyl-phosphate GlcNAc-1-phosphate transferase
MPDYFKSPTFWSLFLFGLVATAVLTPGVIWVATQMGVMDRGGYRRVGVLSRPLLGGWSIAIPFVLVCVLGYFEPTNMFRIVHLNIDPYAFLVLAGGSVAIAALGAYDDIRGTRVRYKLAVQIGVGVFVSLSGFTLNRIELPFGRLVTLDAFSGTCLTVLWIVAITNALNLIDGVDGLAAGVALIACFGFGVIAMQKGTTFVVLLSALLGGSLLAFLAYNSYPARVFLGDTGSMFLGFALAAIGLMGNYKSQITTIWFPAILVLGLPILETVLSMLRRFVQGRPLFAADAHHTHHRLLRMGLSQRQVVLVLYGVSLLLAGAGILNQVIPRGHYAWWVPHLLYGATIVGVIWGAGYVNPPESFKTYWHLRNQSVVLRALSQYAILALSGRRGVANATDIFHAIRAELGLDFLSAWFEEGPVLIGSCGAYSSDGSDLTHLDSVERIRVKTASGQHIIIRFRINKDVMEHELDAVMACIVRIFENAQISLKNIAEEEKAREEAALWKEMLEVSETVRGKEKAQ